jgi:hypothetical protein
LKLPTIFFANVCAPASNAATLSGFFAARAVLTSFM